MEKWKAILKGSWKHIGFVALNLIIVFANIIAPRILNKPELNIVASRALADENETRLSNTVAYVTSEIFQYTEEGNLFFSDERCFFCAPRNFVGPKLLQRTSYRSN